ncbi:MAG: type IV secretory system conjugative DNA transfer family protein [Lachnospiraceae bacterium]|nr:type IV secretory system conjugative DNA transfer family protein [Lachnospiraceae bacterium]
MKKKYNYWIGDSKYRAGKYDYSEYQVAKQELKAAQNNNCIPLPLSLSRSHDRGFCFGLNSNSDPTQYVGFSQGTEGNILIAGGNGSGKSTGIIKPTLATWSGAICATDIKGELCDYYAKLYARGIAKRPYIIFNPFKYSTSYDPFYCLRQDEDGNLTNRIWEIVRANIPDIPNDNQPFWSESEQGILAAAIHYYYKLGLNFSDTLIAIVSTSTTDLIKKIKQNNEDISKMYLGEMLEMKSETLANFDRGIRNKLMLFAADPYINNAFRVTQNETDYFTWQDLDKYNIFIQIPEEQIEQWSGAINLMYTQLIRHLERRPDKYSFEGVNNIPTLLLMDEFARFGKLPLMTDAISTLRSRNVNICIVIQSLAQLDKIYGENDRRIILDNCQFQAILHANDAETQQYFSSLIGTQKGIQESFGESWDDELNDVRYNRQISETLEYRIPPHEFSSLNDVLLLSPFGFCRINKIQASCNLFDQPYKPNSSIIYATVMEHPDRLQIANTVEPVCTCIVQKTPEIMPKEIKELPTIEERIRAVKDLIETLERQKRITDRNNREAQEKKRKRQCYLIGNLVSNYFPEILCLESDGTDETTISLNFLESFLLVLSEDKELMEQLNQKAKNRAQSNETCVSGQEEKTTK